MLMVPILLQVIQIVISKVDLNRKNPRIIMGIEVHLTDSQKPYLHPNKGEHKVILLVVVVLVVVLVPVEEEEDHKVDHKVDVVEVPGNNSNIYSNMPRLKQQPKLHNKRHNNSNTWTNHPGHRPPHPQKQSDNSHSYP